MKTIIDIVDLSMHFQDHIVLDHINLQIKQGEIVALLGPSGVGKTTLIRILSAQLKPTGGQVLIFGEDPLRKRESLYQKCNTLMDTMGLYERLTVWENMRFYAEIYDIPMIRIDEVLQQVGLYDARHTLCAKLSKGMRNRLALARTLLNHAEILFLDEPTSGLDPYHTKVIHRILKAEKQKGTTMLLTTHDMAEAQSLCDHVALLFQGKIVEYGTPKEICNRHNVLNCLYIQCKDGQRFTMKQDKHAAIKIKELLEKEMIETIHSSEPDLETVFLSLTGKRYDSDETCESNI